MTEKLSSSAQARPQEMQARQKRQRLITALIVAGGLVAIVAIVLLARQAPGGEPEAVTLPESTASPADANGRAWGPADAPVVIEEFGDFQ